MVGVSCDILFGQNEVKMETRKDGRQVTLVLCCCVVDMTCECVRGFPLVNARKYLSTLPNYHMIKEPNFLLS